MKLRFGIAKIWQDAVMSNDVQYSSYSAAFSHTNLNAKKTILTPTIQIHVSPPILALGLKELILLESTMLVLDSNMAVYIV